MTYDIAIVGGGIIGLATGRELLHRHPHAALAVLEKEARVGAHQTGHNSGVIHSGIYYAPGSLKARLCMQGRRALWKFCDAKGIEYHQAGKLIVATQAHELGRLQALWERGIANCIEGLAMLEGDAIAQREPHCRGIKAIYSPVTGIVDYGAVARAIADDIREAGGEILTGRKVEGIRRSNGLSRIATAGGDIEARHVIACGGLMADRLAKMTGGKSDPKIVPFRGDYLLLKPGKRHLVKGNIYPVPDPAFPFLGAHFTRRLNGDVLLGPNAVLAFAREGYGFSSVNAGDLVETLTYPGFLRLAVKYMAVGMGEMYRDLVRSAYVRALQRYIPELRVEDTLPGPSGVRAQAMRADGSMVDDLVFEETEGVVHVRNAPSPGATSSLAIASYIADVAQKRFGLGTTPAVV